MKLVTIMRKMINARAENIKSFQNFREPKKCTERAELVLDDKYFRVYDFLIYEREIMAFWVQQ